MNTTTTRLILTALIGATVLILTLISQRDTSCDWHSGSMADYRCAAMDARS